MTIEELSNDTFFLEGLRKGEFCLVMGAGFSYGLKNRTAPDSLNQIDKIKFDDFNTIPLVDQYVSLTNKIFNATVTKGEAAANIWVNKNFSVLENGETFDLKPFYQDLFSLDEDWFKDNQLQFYKNILIPDWHQVYTFNFDNVFETIVKLKVRSDFYSLHFPEHSGIHRTENKAVVHLHGYISKTPPEKLTFSDDTYNILRDTKHTLYDQFYTDVDTGKKIVIIGTQFDEKVIDDKFFSGLEHKNITIYHFDRKNDNFKTKPGIANNLNYHFVQINSTLEILDFFEKHRTQIENIQIDGAITVTEEFVKEVNQKGKEKEFSAADFYLAKQDDDCQWYGVTRKWVIERENYNRIKEAVVSSFADKNRHSKISALVWGSGGSGKSTLLRMLAVDFCKEDFAVLWIRNTEIAKFSEKGLTELQTNYSHRQFLVVIEDLYRVMQQDINLKSVIDSICSNSNIRLVVGDRKNDDNSYKEHIYDPDQNIFELSVSDNKKTLDQLLKNIPEWRDAAEKLLTSDDDYQSSLYYILWTIGRTAQKVAEGITTITSQDLESHFRSLVVSDLKALTGNYNRGDDKFTEYYYPGIAKMLYYWASIYTTNKIHISYDLFFKLADIFRESSTNESIQILASPLLKSILDIYTHEAKGFIKSAGELPLLAFNHDILAEQGLSNAKLSEWLSFDDSIKLKMLQVVIDDGDSFSASSFLLPCLRHIPDSVFSKEEKLERVNQLRAKGIFKSYLTAAFTKDFFSDKEKSDLADEILQQENFWNLSHQIVSTALNISKDKAKADEILQQENFWNLPQGIVSKALNISQNKAKADEILQQENFWNLPYQLVSTALNISQNKAKADEILQQENFWNLPHDIVSTALNISKDKVKADEILQQENFWNLPHDIVNVVLNISKDKVKANEILQQDNFWNLSKEVVSTALNISQNKVKADEILQQENFWNLPQGIVNTALNISQNKAKADEILQQENFWKELPFDIVSTALKISDNKELKEKFAKILFASVEWKEKWSLTYHILYYYSREQEIPANARQIIEAIIAEYVDKNNKDKGKYLRYVNLMKIPFHSVPIWKNTSLENIRNWKFRQRNLATNTIVAYRSKPAEIKGMCKAILETWRIEIKKPIYILGRRKTKPHLGDHIRLSLGHPDLQQLALQTAEQIRLTELKSPRIIPEHLMEAVSKIVDDKIFPPWSDEEL